MGYNNGYESGYSDALEDVRSGKVAGIGPSGGGAGKKYTAVIVGTNFQPIANLGKLPEEDVLKVTMEDLGVDSASSDPQTVDFNRIADKLAPVVAFDIFLDVSATDIAVAGPAGYNWNFLESSIYPRAETSAALSAVGDSYMLS